MTRWGAGAWDRKQNAVSVSFTVLYFVPKKLRTTFHPTHRVILSEAAPPANIQALPPIIAAQSNPAPSGAPAGGISLAERCHIKHRTALCPCPGGRNALHGTFKQRRSRLLAPRQGGGVRLRGNVWLSRSPLNPVCRFAQDDTWGNRGAVPYMFGVKDSTVNLNDMVFCFLADMAFYFPD